jgi:hypothetical protein
VSPLGHSSWGRFPRPTRPSSRRDDRRGDCPRDLVQHQSWGANPLWPIRAKQTERLVAALIPPTTAPTVAVPDAAATVLPLPALAPVQPARFVHRTALLDDHRWVREATAGYAQAASTENNRWLPPVNESVYMNRVESSTTVSVPASSTCGAAMAGP